MSTISQNAFSDIFPKQSGIFSPNFTRLLNVHMHARMQIFIQSASLASPFCPIHYIAIIIIIFVTTIIIIYLISDNSYLQYRM